MKRRNFISLFAGAAVLRPLIARGQNPKLARLGFLGPASSTGFQVQALRAGLSDYGYVEGRNIHIEYRFAEDHYERLPALANELVDAKVDLIVTHSTPGTQAAKAATSTIPIVMGLSGDAVALGLVQSLSRPGGNVTGSTFLNPELMAKRLELLKALSAPIRRVAILLNRGNPIDTPVSQMTEQAAKPLHIELKEFYVRGPSEFDGTFAEIADQRLDAVVVEDDPMLIVNSEQIAQIVGKRRMIAIGYLELAAAGGLLAYGVNLFKLFRRAGYFVDRILKGASPADLPVEQPTKFELVINLKAAKALGLTVPVSLLAAADDVIE